MRFFILILIVLPCLLLSQEPSESVKPKGVFSVMLWNYQGRQDFVFAPWGNHTEANATILPLSLFSGNPSQKYVHYGPGKLTLLKERDFSELEQGGPKFEKVTEVTLPLKNDRVSESFLLLSPLGATGGWKASVLDFDQKSLPPGSFSFVSRASIPLDVAFGESKFSLSPGGRKTVEGKIMEGERVIELTVFSRSKGASPALSRKWPHVNGLRGMMFLGGRENRIQVTRFVDFPKPVEEAVGYGLSRTTIPNEETEGPNQ